MAGVEWKDEPFQRFRQQIRTGLAAGLRGPFARTFKLWGVVYRSFVQRRFKRFSRGGGNWQKLAESTIRGRRAGRKGPRTKGGRRGKAGAAAGGKVSILVDKLHSLQKALAPVFSGVAGSLEAGIPYGLRVGYGGPGRHPKGKATIADIARFHNEGLGSVPKRQIIVEPEAKVMNKMKNVLEKDVDALIRSLGGD